MTEIRKFITLTTGHLTAETARMLNTARHPNHWPVLGGPFGDYGWFIYATDENDGSIPDDIWRVMCWANLQEVHYILFDRDGEPVDELPLYEW